jgi:DNA-directed RNA polymerase subunit RPC12/RpoP
MLQFKKQEEFRMLQDSQSQKAVSRSFNYGTFQIVLGGFLTFVFGITFLSCIADLLTLDSTMDVWTFMIIMIILGLSVYLLICGILRLRLIKLHRNYMQLLSQGPCHSIDQLASILKSPVHIVKSNLIMMMNKKYLTAAYIDENTNSLIITSFNQRANAIPKQNLNRQLNNMVQPQKMIEYITVTCNNCGASNKIMKGASTECEYCGSNIH